MKLLIQYVFRFFTLITKFPIVVGYQTQKLALWNTAEGFCVTFFISKYINKSFSGICFRQSFIVTSLSSFQCGNFFKPFSCHHGPGHSNLSRRQNTRH